MIHSEIYHQLDTLFDIFEKSNGVIRPHFILTGPSGSGKSYTIQELANKRDINLLEINAAQLTKEGTSGNSLSNAYENNTLGYRIITTLLHQYFIKGGFPENETKKITFQTKLSINRQRTGT